MLLFEGGFFRDPGFARMNALSAVLMCLMGSIGCLRLTNMTAPIVADPREDMVLQCRFDMGSEELYAVKWYKDDDEFFRYTPGVQPQTILFRVDGVTVKTDTKTGSGSVCQHDRCDLVLTNLTREHSSGAYRCEVSSEAPAFRLASNTRNITVAALPNDKPRIEGLSESYIVGDILTATCVSSPSDPKPTLTFYLNKQKAPIQYVKDILVPAKEDGYQMKTRTIQLRIQIDRKHLLQQGGKFEIKCVSTVPGIPETISPPLVSTKTFTILLDHHQQLINNQKLHWPNASSPLCHAWHKTHMSVIVFCVLLKSW